MVWTSMARGGRMFLNFRGTGGGCYRRETWSVVGTDSFAYYQRFPPCIANAKTRHVFIVRWLMWSGWSGIR